MALLLGANRELDSSITIKSIVSHVVQRRAKRWLSHTRDTRRESDATRVRRRGNKEQHRTRMRVGLALSLSNDELVGTLEEIVLTTYACCAALLNVCERESPIVRDDHRDIERFILDIATKGCAHQRNEKISNKISFGIIDKADSSTSDRIIVIVDTACLIHGGACR